jgi:hypothetical protein
VSVDTYLKRKNISRYQAFNQDGLKVLVAFPLMQWGKAIDLNLRRLLIWKSFDVVVTPKRVHAHGPT